MYILFVIIRTITLWRKTDVSSVKKVKGLAQLLKKVNILKIIRFMKKSHSFCLQLLVLFDFEQKKTCSQ